MRIIRIAAFSAAVLGLCAVQATTAGAQEETETAALEDTGSHPAKEAEVGEGFVKSPHAATGLATDRDGDKREEKEAAEKQEKEAEPEVPFGDLIATYAEKNGIDIELAHAVVQVESSYRAGATGAAGEIGLMQLKFTTAQMMGYSGSAKDLYDPETNIKYGMKYLAKAQELGDGSICGTILKYNAGHGATRMNPISQRYCTKVTAML